jgi:heme A synthase
MIAILDNLAAWMQRAERPEAMLALAILYGVACLSASFGAFLVIGRGVKR